MNTLKEHQDKLEGLAKLLIEKETLSREDFVQFVDDMPQTQSESPAPATEEESAE